MAEEFAPLKGHIRKCLPGGNIKSIAAPSEKHMEGKVDYQESQTNGDEEVDVDEEDGVADQAEYAS